MSIREPELLRMIEDGLPHLPTNAGVPIGARVIVVGAGMAGLVCAEQLVDAGHEVTVLEGRSRVGGRIETLRAPFAPGLYAEAGAMRLPRSHQLTMAYVERFGLETFPFTLTNPTCYVHLHGTRWHLSEVETEPSILGFDGVEEATILAMWDKEIGASATAGCRRR